MRKFPAVLFFNLVFGVFGIFYLPFFLLKLKQAESPGRLWSERFGFLKKELAEKLRQKRVFWIHAVSVGEVNAIKRFMEGALQRFPESHFVLTTVTATGQRIAQTMAGERVSVLYVPFDFSFTVKSFFKTIQPCCLILVETEIWPNLILEAKARKVPVGLVNARLSKKSFGRYKKVHGLVTGFFRTLEFVLAQTREDGERFLQLGVRPEKLYVMGNMKFDNFPFEEREQDSKEALKREWGFSPEDVVWVAGSTHPGEEKELAKIFLRIRARFPKLKLLIAPRHVERSLKLAGELKALGLRAALGTDKRVSSEFDVLVLNQMGILKKIYALSDAVFVGGSLVRHGGQNPIEPAVLKCALLHGPHVFNFSAIYKQLDAEEGAGLVRDAGELEARLVSLLENREAACEMGERAYRIVQELRGATDQTLHWLEHFVNKRTEQSCCETVCRS